mgnify:CR=1 FL=1
MTAGGPRFDSARFGMEVFRPSPRQADLMIVAGRVSQKMAPVLRQIYDQMAEPKWVLAMGVCASSGGMFNNYAIVQGVDHVVPVDMYLPGCPPRPEMLIDAILKLHDKIMNEPLGPNAGEAARRSEGASSSRQARGSPDDSDQPAKLRPRRRSSWRPTSTSTPVAGSTVDSPFGVEGRGMFGVQAPATRPASAAWSGEPCVHQPPLARSAAISTRSSTHWQLRTRNSTQRSPRSSSIADELTLYVDREHIRSVAPSDARRPAAAVRAVLVACPASTTSAA